MGSQRRLLLPTVNIGHKMKRTDPKSISQIINEALQSSGMTSSFNEQKLCYLWPEIVGAAVNRHTTRRYIDHGTLHVYMSSASLKNELSFLRERLVKQLNSAVGAHVIDNIAIH